LKTTVVTDSNLSTVVITEMLSLSLYSITVNNCQVSIQA